MPCYRTDGTVAGEHVWGLWCPRRYDPSGRTELRACERCPEVEVREVVRDG